MTYYMHQKNVDTLCSISINALSSNINMAACHYACVDGCSNKLTVNGFLHHRNMAAMLPVCCRLLTWLLVWNDFLCALQWYRHVPLHTVNVTHITDTWLPLSQYHTLTFIRRMHTVLLNQHLTNAPNRWPFKCPVHSYRSLEL